MDCRSTIVKVTGYEIVPSKPQYALHIIKIITSGLSMWEVRRRYTDFVYLHQKLKTFVDEKNLPVLPPKKFLGSSFDPTFLEQRGNALEEYLQSLIANSVVWTKIDLACFLDNESKSFVFLWNFEKMRKMQEVFFYQLTY